MSMSREISKASSSDRLICWPVIFRLQRVLHPDAIRFMVLDVSLVLCS